MIVLRTLIVNDKKTVRVKMPSQEEKDREKSETCPHMSRQLIG